MSATRATRRPRALIFGCAAACALYVLSPSRSAFVANNGSEVTRRQIVQWLPAATAAAGAASPAFAEELKKGKTTPWQTRPDGSEDTIHTGGVEWEDIKIGTGSTPKIGQLVAINFVASCNVKEREITIEDTNGKAKDYRFGIGQMLAGMDEGVRGMRTGGVRKMSIPGELAFGSKAVPAAVGRPSIPAYTPIDVTVTLEFIPGADSVYEYGQEDEK